jgi:hypothetical protein
VQWDGDRFEGWNARFLLVGEDGFDDRRQRREVFAPPACEVGRDFR